ncbi:MAG TPA: SlyX family protein [Chromatiales bacterium]|nr:SlyX family protein [Chromatiales bacterium]
MNPEAEARITELEIRIAHLEDALDQVTRSLLEQERGQQEMTLQIEMLREQLRSQATAASSAIPEDERPPHY